VNKKQKQLQFTQHDNNNYCNVMSFRVVQKNNPPSFAWSAVRCPVKYWMLKFTK